MYLESYCLVALQIAKALTTLELPSATLEVTGKTPITQVEWLRQPAQWVLRLTESRSSIATTTRTFDANGNVKTQIDPKGNVTTFIYDDRNRLVQKQEPGGMSISYTYDKNDQVLTETRTGGFARTYTRDKMNRVLTDTDSLGKVATSIYDLRGLRTTHTDRRGGVTLTAYEGMRYDPREVRPETGTTRDTQTSQ